MGFLLHICFLFVAYLHSCNDSMSCVSLRGRSALSCRIMWHLMSLSPAPTFLPCYISLFLIPRFSMHFICFLFIFLLPSRMLFPPFLWAFHHMHTHTHTLPSRNPSCQCMCVGVFIDGWTGKMDEVNGGVYRWKRPFCQQSTRLILVLVTRAHMFFLYSIYLHLQSITVWSVHFSSRSILVANVTVYVCLFIPEWLAQQHYLQINEHVHITQLIIYRSNTFKLNRIFLRPTSWFVGGSGRGENIA